MNNIWPWTCKCGRLHDITEEIYNRMMNGEQIVMKCEHCGEKFVRGLEETCDEYSEDENAIAYNCYSFSYEEQNKDLFIYISRGISVPMMCGHDADNSANNSPICSKCCPQNERFVILARDRHPSYVVNMNKIPKYPYCDTGMSSRW